MPSTKQVTNFDPITVINVTMDYVLLGTPVACLKGRSRLNYRGRGGRGTYLDEGELAGALVLVVNDHFSVKVNPPLTSTK